MIQVKGFAALSSSTPIVPYAFSRREVGPTDILIDIAYCGICHSDIHQARDEWGGAAYPMVPGHEIVGRVSRVGKKVKRFRVGDFAGVGCFVDSCRKCRPCKRSEEQYCEKHTAFTYNSTEMDEKTPTQGGYSTQLAVDQAYALKVARSAPLERVAPLLCAGITTYSPLKQHGIKKGQDVGVVGLGGLGHMGVKIAAAMGARVTVFSTSPNKEKDARRLGAKRFVNTKDPKSFEKLTNSYDLILDTVSAPHDLNPYLQSLKHDGVMVLVGLPSKPAEVEAFSLLVGRKCLTGSMIGGIRETQEMLDFCTRKKVFSDVEVIRANQINEAYERTIRGDVKYRFVIDCSTI